MLFGNLWVRGWLHGEFQPGCWRIEERRIIWITKAHVLIHPPKNPAFETPLLVANQKKRWLFNRVIFYTVIVLWILWDFDMQLLNGGYSTVDTLPFDKKMNFIINLRSTKYFLSFQASFKPWYLINFLSISFTHNYVTFSSWFFVIIFLWFWRFGWTSSLLLCFPINMKLYFYTKGASNWNY